jgi:hypothetical protein
MIERRKYPRFELKVDAKYRIVDSEEILKYGTTRNISAEGLCFESDERLGVGVLIELEVDLKDKMPPVSFIGEIRWFQEFNAPGLKQKRFVNGVKLINIPQSDEGRFLKYYCDMMVQKLSGYLNI